MASLRNSKKKVQPRLKNVTKKMLAGPLTDTGCEIRMAVTGHIVNNQQGGMGRIKAQVLPLLCQSI